MVEIRPHSDDKTSLDKNVEASRNNDTSDDKGGGDDDCHERLSQSENVKKCQSQSSRS